MGQYILRRLLQGIPVLVGISLITFVLIYYLPADPARMYAGPHASVETVARIREELGLNDPLWSQYLHYVGRALRGDLGFSYDLQMPVLQAILARFPYTFMFSALCIARSPVTNRSVREEVRFFVMRTSDVVRETRLDRQRSRCS